MQPRVGLRAGERRGELVDHRQREDVPGRRVQLQPQPGAIFIAVAEHRRAHTAAPAPLPAAPARRARRQGRRIAGRPLADEVATQDAAGAPYSAGSGATHGTAAASAPACAGGTGTTTAEGRNAAATTSRSGCAAAASSAVDDRHLGRRQQRRRQRREHERRDARLAAQPSAPGPQHAPRPAPGSRRRRSRAPAPAGSSPRPSVAAGSAPSYSSSWPQQHRRVLAGRREPAGVVGRREQAVERGVQRPRPAQPRRIAVGLEELQQAPRQAGVVLREGVDAGGAGGVAAPEPAGRLVPQRVARTSRSAARRPGGAAPVGGLALDRALRARPGPGRARAHAAIISPFQAVSTLSSRSGRGRARRASNSRCRPRASASPTAAGASPVSLATSAMVRAV